MRPIDADELRLKYLNLFMQTEMMAVRPITANLFKDMVKKDPSIGIPAGIPMEHLYKVLEMAPTLDVAPMVHEEWKEWDEDTWSCSVCGEPWTLTEGTPKDNGMNYCPNCGARMDGKEDL